MWIPRSIETSLRQRAATRAVVVLTGARQTGKGWLELFEANWTELPDRTDLVNLRFAREALGPPKVRSAAVVCRAPNGFPLEEGCRAVPVEELSSGRPAVGW